jgi:hypothetical protein
VRLAGRLDLRNNVVFNWQTRTTDGGVRELNFVNNIYLPGPATRVFTLLKPDPGDPERGMRAHMAGNEIEGKPAVAADNWAAYVGPADGMAKVRSEVPVFDPFVASQTAREALHSVLADVGANRPKPDAVDLRVLADVRKRGHTFTGSRGKLPGIIDTPADAGGLPEYRSADAPPDSDGDGIPDAWEAAHGLDPKNPADAGAYRPDGYTNLEHYLNDLAAPDPYAATAAERAAAAVRAAAPLDSDRADRAWQSVAAHYTGLNRIHTERDVAVKATGGDVAGIAAARSRAEAELKVLHAAFLAELSAALTPAQAEAIKDQMTYNVRPTTLKAYRELLPTLTDTQVSHIDGLLTAGREEALVAGSSSQKHEKFRLAKGRMVNYLSAQGYDLKAAERALAEKKKPDKN